MTQFNKTELQHKAISLMAGKIEVLLEGGSRSGKTFIGVYAILVRAARYAETRHVILRRAFNHVKQSIWYQTIPDVRKKAMPELILQENRTDWFFRLTNGSEIWIAGTDDKERIEKILGTEWATIYLNEASQMPYSTYELLKTRLNPPKHVKPLYLIDQNPPSMQHWTYKRFHQLINPENSTPLKDKEKERQAYIRMNPADNKENLSESYIETLETMSEQKKRRFMYGEYGDDSERALWRREWIINNRSVKPETLDRVVVGVDPAVTGDETSDATGIVVVGRRNDDYYVLADRTYRGGVTGWGAEVAAIYKTFMADAVIGETNNGGDLVEMNIRTYGNVNFQKVHASRGKAVRAEPIADLYRRGLVRHVEEFTELEDMLCTWTPDAGYSPDNMDALVWALSYLSGISSGMMSVSSYGLEELGL